jgi:hypothetical protein
MLGSVGRKRPWMQCVRTKNAACARFPALAGGEDVSFSLPEFSVENDGMLKRGTA